MAKVKYTSNLDNAMQFFEDKVVDAMAAIQVEYAKDVSRRLDEPPKRSGQIYPVKGNRGNKHQASRPGESPAPMSREYLESIFSEVLRTKRPLYRGAVWTPVTQAAVLELGLGDFEGAPRPAWMRTLVENRRKYSSLLKQNLRRGMRYGGSVD